MWKFCMANLPTLCAGTAGWASVGHHPLCPFSGAAAHSTGITHFSDHSIECASVSWAANGVSHVVENHTSKIDSCQLRQKKNQVAERLLYLYLEKLRRHGTSICCQWYTDLNSWILTNPYYMLKAEKDW